ncbi:unnamed protein product [Symbiodinium necroappetens]|uniref:Uncharacterized protein n=1 Tax=Symbiodinium necroappetens TaxID=1628268 RepID=A0A813B5U0_9DINO|nr:unnamed protein product [Symbiodinium necroappetens]
METAHRRRRQMAGRSSQNDFPAYDEGWQQAAEVMEMSTSTSLPRAPPSSASSSGLVHDVQSAINQARKLEGRLKKLQKEALQKGRSWDAWVLKMRNSYAREHERHQNEQRRLAADIKEAEDMTMAAYLQVQDAAFKQQRSTKEAIPPPLAWESAMEVEQEQPDMPTRQELERMLQIVQTRRGDHSTPPRPTGAAPLTPPGISQGYRMDLSPGPPVTSDGYPTPPSRSPAPTSATTAGPADPRAPPAADLPSKGQSALSAKLSEKRRSMRQAMAPFGIGKKPATAQGHDETNTTLEEAARPPDQALIDDDPDELCHWKTESSAETDPRTVFVLDFSYWNGPVFAVADWRYVSLTTLAAEARRFAPVPWQVSHGRQDSLLLPGATLFAAPGDVFRFTPCDLPCAPKLTLGQMLLDAALWDISPPFIPREEASHAWLVLRSHVTRTPIYSGTSRDELFQLAADSTHSEVNDLHFGMPLDDSPLQEIVYQGRSLRGVLAAEPRSGNGPGLGAFVFVDARLLGLNPSFRYCPAGWVDLAYFTAYLALKIPNGYHLEASGMCHVTQQAVPRPLPLQTATSQTSASPLQPVTETATPTGPFQRCHFLIFSVDFQPEALTLELPVPCVLEQAMQTIADSRTADIAFDFDNLLPACPQPDDSFGALLALPEWYSLDAIILIDIRTIDGRIFAMNTKGRLNRSSILLHAQINDGPDIQVFLRGGPVDSTTWYEFHSGETIFIRHRDSPPAPAVYLDDMLQDEHDWCEICPLFEGPLFPAFRLPALQISDGLLASISVLPNPVFCSSSPRVTDLAVCGQACKAILVASEKVLRLPTPPGRLSLYTPIAFLGCRRVLQGFSWIAAERGLLDLEQVSASFQDTAPEGYSPNVRGADTEIRLGRPYLRITFGTLLTVTFVANTAESDDDSSPPSSGPSTDDDHEAEVPPSNPDDGAIDAPISSKPRANSHSRSRSPRPTGAGEANGHALVCYDIVHAALHSAKPCNFSWLSPIQEFLECGPNTLPGMPEPYDAVSLASPCDVLSLLFEPFWGKHRDFTVNPCTLFSCCKLLHEPRSSSPALSQLVADLRRITTRLDQPWRYAAAEDDIQLADAAETASTQTASSEEPTLLHFVLLSPGRTATHIAFHHVLPATLDEVLAQTQAERTPDDRLRFPNVVPASPQPCPGSGVLLALPSWCRDDPTALCFLCLDLTAVDGRILAVVSPHYVSRRHLLHMADLPIESDIAVHMKDDFMPLPGNLQYHVATGDTFLFLPSGAVAPTLHDLTQELLSHRAWSPILTVPTVSAGQHLCLVHENETILFQPTIGSPTTLHAQIAACIGSSRRFLRLFPSSPRVTDAALHGVPCRTVLSVCLPPSQMPAPFHGVIIDARAILAGWRTFPAIAGRFSCNTVLVDLQRGLPAGWRTRFLDIPLGVDLIDTSPGQVLTAFAELIPSQGAVTAAPERTDASGHHAAERGATGPSPVPVGQAPAGDTPTGGPTPGGYEARRGGRAPHEDPHAPRTDSFLTRVFLVLGQNYLPETIEVRLPAEITVERALEQVAAARHPRDAYFLPSLLAVKPQPCSSHALLLAAPAWPPAGALVAFDCRPVGGSAFALHLFGSLTRQELLRAARLDADFQGDIYVGSLPWALAKGLLSP